MALDVTTDGDRVTITGSGPSLLKVKAEIAKLAGDGEVFSIGRSSFVAPLRAYQQAKAFLHGVFAEDSASTQVIANQKETDDRHRDAKNRVNEIAENGESLTGLEHWDHILDPHQGIAANAMSVHGLAGICLFDEQGTGKTISALAAFDILRGRGEVDGVVVLAPKTLQENWRQEAQKFLPEQPSIVTLDGSKEERYAKLRSTSDFYLATYEALESELTLFIAIAKNRKLLLVVDESFFVKNPHANRSMAAREFRRYCTRALILCGTPAPNSPSDLIHQFDLSDNGYSFGGITPPKEPEKAREFVESVIEQRGVYLRRTKDMVLPDLPEKHFHVVGVDMGPKQTMLYSEARDELALLLKTLDNRTFRRNLTTYFQKRAAMLQICVSPKLIDQMIDEQPAKYIALDRLLKNEIQEKDNKVVVWSVYTKTIDDLIDRYHAYLPARVDGKVSDVRERQSMVERFQNDPDTKLFVGNPAAAGAGITLHASHVSVYLSFSNQAAHYMQSLDRIHRRGQTSNSVDYYFLVCKETIEQNELGRLTSKQRTQSDLLGDIVEVKFTLEDALREIGEL